MIAPLSGKQRKELRGETPQEERTSDKKSTTIDDIRDLIKRSYQKPLEGLRKVYIITDAGKMTPGAAICLLKTLEEPPPNVTFILVAEAPSALPPTLVSRCQILTFSLLPEELIINRLIEEHGASPEEAARAASLSAGSLGKAIKLMENEVKWKLREDSLNFAGRLSSASLFELIESAPQWAPEPRKKKKAGAAPEEGSPQDAEEDDPEDKNESLLAFLEYLLGWFRDILVLQEGAPERLVMNRDRLPILTKWRGILNRSHIMEIISLILESNSQLKGNANGRLLLQNLFVKINEKLRIIEEM
jgi:DNA polymerase-3 subunit delta'